MAGTALPSDFHPRRGKARLRLGIPAEVITVHGRHKVSLLDLSESGARLRIQDAEPIGHVVLKWMDYEAFGSVVRRVGQEAGLHFDESIERAWLLATREWLPEVARQDDGVRRFARDWVTGGQSHAVPVRSPRRSVTALPHLAAASSIQALDWERRSIVMSWLGAGKPFMIGGAVLGLVAGYWSTLL